MESSFCKKIFLNEYKYPWFHDKFDSRIELTKLAYICLYTSEDWDSINYIPSVRKQVKNWNILKKSQNTL